MRGPSYSTTRAPLRIGAFVNTPTEWMREGRTTRAMQLISHARTCEGSPQREFCRWFAKSHRMAGLARSSEIPDRRAVDGLCARIIDRALLRNEIGIRAYRYAATDRKPSFRSPASGPTPAFPRAASFVQRVEPASARLAAASAAAVRSIVRSRARNCRERSGSMR